MQANGWIALLKHLPPEQHRSLMVVTRAGREIPVQTLVRIDHEFLAFKGRPAGSQDQGLLFMLPYQNIDYINFQRLVKDEECEELFGTLTMPLPAQPGLVIAAGPLPELIPNEVIAELESLPTPVEAESAA